MESKPLGAVRWLAPFGQVACGALTLLRKLPSLVSTLPRLRQIKRPRLSLRRRYFSYRPQSPRPSVYLIFAPYKE